MEEQPENIKKTLNVLEYLHLFVSSIKTIFIFVLVSLLIGWVIILISPRGYVSTAKTIHRYSKTQNNNTNPTSIRVNSAQEIIPNDNMSIQNRENDYIDGLPQHIIVEISTSSRYLLAVAKEKCIPISSDSSISYMEYLAGQKRKINIFKVLKKYTIGLPGLIIKKLKKTPKNPFLNSSTNNFLTPKEKSAIESLADKITITVNQAEKDEFQILDFNVKTNSPSLSVFLCEAAMRSMQRELLQITTKKISKNLKYVNRKFIEVQKQMASTEQDLAKFMDRNLDPQDARLKVEVERLRRKVSFISLLYQDLQSQKTQVEINLEKTEPVFSTITSPQPGVKEGLGLKKTTIKYFVLGFGLSIIFIALKINFKTLNDNYETSQKLQVIVDELKANHLYYDKEILKKLIQKITKKDIFKDDIED